MEGLIMWSWIIKRMSSVHMIHLKAFQMQMLKTKLLIFNTFIFLKTFLYSDFLLNFWPGPAGAISP